MVFEPTNSGSLESIMTPDAGRPAIEDTFNPLILAAQVSQSVAEILTSLKRPGKNEELNDRIRALFTGLVGIGEIDDRSGTPYKTLKRALKRINFSGLLEDYYTDRTKSLEKAHEVIENIDSNRIELLEDSLVIPVKINNPAKILSGFNIVAFDGGSLPIYNYSCSTVYARGGSFGYSQRDNDPRLSFESGVNRIWCDAAINIASRPNVFNDEVRKWQLDQIADDTTGQIALTDRVKRAEIYLLSMVEAASVILCLRDYAGVIDLVVLDGPLFFGHHAFEASYTRMQALRNSNKPCYGVVKNPSGSPIMRACNVGDTSDVAFFEYLEPGERSPMFLRHDEGRLNIPDPYLKRVFWYGKTERGYLCRYEIPLWCYEDGNLPFDQISTADTLLNGGKMSFFLSRVDALVRLRRNFRVMLTALQRASFHSKGIRFTEPYNQIRWGRV